MARKRRGDPNRHGDKATLPPWVRSFPGIGRTANNARDTRPDSFEQHPPYYGNQLAPWGYSSFDHLFRPLSDDQIADNVDHMLDNNPVTAHADIHAEVKEGTVILDGTVRTATAKRTAEHIVWPLPGVRDVQNRIEIKSRARERAEAKT